MVLPKHSQSWSLLAIIKKTVLVLFFKGFLEICHGLKSFKEGKSLGSYTEVVASFKSVMIRLGEIITPNEWTVHQLPIFEFKHLPTI